MKLIQLSFSPIMISKECWEPEKVSILTYAKDKYHNAYLDGS